MALEDMCIDSMTFLRPSVPIGSMGGTAYDYVNAEEIATINVNIQSASPRDIEKFARRDIRVSHNIFPAAQVEVRVGDGAVNPNDSTQFFVVKFISDMGGMHSAFRIYADLIPNWVAPPITFTVLSVVGEATPDALVTFSADVTASQWTGAELEIEVGGVYYPGAAVTQPVGQTTQLVFTSPNWTGNPAGKAYRVQSGPGGLVVPVFGNVS